MGMTKAEKITELQEERAVVHAALIKAYKAKSYSIADRQKTMHEIDSLRDIRKQIDQELAGLERETGGISISYGVPE